MAYFGIEILDLFTLFLKLITINVFNMFSSCLNVNLSGSIAEMALVKDL